METFNIQNWRVAVRNKGSFDWLYQLRKPTGGFGGLALPSTIRYAGKRKSWGVNRPRGYTHPEDVPAPGPHLLAPHQSPGWDFHTSGNPGSGHTHVSSVLLTLSSGGVPRRKEQGLGTEATAICWLWELDQVSKAFRVRFAAHRKPCPRFRICVDFLERYTSGTARGLVERAIAQ